MSDQKKKTYLELYLDSTVDKKRGIYFGDAQEQAIIQFNSEFSSQEDKRRLFVDLIEPAFRKVISGVLEMPKFHNLGRLDRDDLIDSTFFRLVEKINRFKEGMISKKTGLPVKAYSYFSTIAKNYILEIKVKHEKIIKNKADVETSIDLSILSEDTLQMMSNYDGNNIMFHDSVSKFDETRNEIIKQIEHIIKLEEAKDKPDVDLIKIGYHLRYIINKWDKIEFMKKNEFMRILTVYTGLKQQQVSLLFKKFKLSILEKINPRLLKSNLSVSDDFDDEVVEEEVEEEIEVDDEIELTEEELKAEQDLEEKYNYFTMEDWDSYHEKEENKLLKAKWKKTS